MEQRTYQQPVVTDLGRLEEITANNNTPEFIDVPQGTPIGQGPVVGSDPFPMS